MEKLLVEGAAEMVCKGCQHYRAKSPICGLHEANPRVSVVLGRIPLLGVVLQRYGTQGLSDQQIYEYAIEVKACLDKSSSFDARGMECTPDGSHIDGQVDD